MQVEPSIRRSIQLGNGEWQIYEARRWHKRSFLAVITVIAFLCLFFCQQTTCPSTLHSRLERSRIIAREFEWEDIAFMGSCLIRDWAIFGFGMSAMQHITQVYYFLQNWVTKNSLCSNCNVILILKSSRRAKLKNPKNYKNSKRIKKLKKKSKEMSKIFKTAGQKL